MFQDKVVIKYCHFIVLIVFMSLLPVNHLTLTVRSGRLRNDASITTSHFDVDVSKAAEELEFTSDYTASMSNEMENV